MKTNTATPLFQNACHGENSSKGPPGRKQLHDMSKTFERHSPYTSDSDRIYSAQCLQLSDNFQTRTMIIKGSLGVHVG